MSPDNELNPDKLPDHVSYCPMGEAIKLLEEMKARKCDDPNEPERLDLRSVERISNVFQIRGSDFTEYHVSELLATLKRLVDLDPITVWRCGKHAILIDGHHRLEAYQRLQSEKMKHQTIPVRWLHASTVEAMEAAASANNRVKLQLTTAQRMDYAWRLTLSEKFSKYETATMANVGTSQVGTMRKVKSTLGDEAISYTRWDKARLACTKNDESKFEPDEIEAWQEAEAMVLADRFARHFSTTLAQRPEITAKALVHHFGRKNLEILRHMLDEAGIRYEIYPDDEDEFSDF